MITYRVAFIGDESEAYLKAQEFFRERNEKNENFEIELVDISNMDELEIKSMHFHSVLYDAKEIAGTDKDEVLRALLESKANISDLKIFPLARKNVTRDDEIGEENRLARLSGRDSKEIKAIPINVLEEVDLRSVFQAIEIASSEYRVMAEDVLEMDDREYDLVEELLLNAMEEKSPYTASHFREVSILSGAIARQARSRSNRCQKEY